MRAVDQVLDPKQGLITMGDTGITTDFIKQLKNMLKVQSELKADMEGDQMIKEAAAYVEKIENSAGLVQQKVTDMFKDQIERIGCRNTPREIKIYR